jgi:hypothetical protein
VRPVFLQVGKALDDREMPTYARKPEQPEIVVLVDLDRKRRFCTTGVVAQ